jgi:nucleotide-binding universal stress UspA family protein
MTTVHSISTTYSECWARPSVLLVATDLTDLDRLMPYAFQQAAKYGARLILLHILASGIGLAMDETGMPYYDPSRALEDATQALEPWCAAACKQGISCDALLREGHAASQIVSTAHRFQADRVFLGTRGRSKLSQLLLGSVADQVLRSVHLPVMTVGPEAQFKADSVEQEKIVLHPTSLRGTSRPSAALACQLAASQGLKLVLLHVLPPIEVMRRKGLPTGLDATALQELHRLAEETGGSCCSAVEPRVVHGNPIIEILAASVELHASLIVLGAARHSGFERLTRDRILCRVLAHAHCPVLTLLGPLTKPVTVPDKAMVVDG